MRTHARTLFTLCTLAALAAWSSVTLAGDYRLVAHEDASVLAEEVTRLQGEVAKMDDLRAQMASLQQKFDANLATDGHAGDCGCSSCCNSCCCIDPCCRSEGFTAGAEVLWLKPHDTNGTGYGYFRPVGTQCVDTSVDPNFEPSYRIWAGYQLCDGLGVRVRYWQFDHSDCATVTIPNIDPVACQGWDVWTLDIEATASTRLGCNWDVTASAGFRYVDFRGDRSILVGTTDISASNDFSGYGLTTSFEVRRQVTCALLGFANVRGSVVMGDETNNDHLGFNGVPAVDVTELQRNDVKFIYEAQIGAEYVVPMCGGGWYYIRGGAEVQYWDSCGTPTPLGPLAEAIDGDGTNNNNGSTAFAGFFLSVGLAR